MIIDAHTKPLVAAINYSLYPNPIGPINYGPHDRIFLTFKNIVDISRT